MWLDQSIESLRSFQRASCGLLGVVAACVMLLFSPTAAAQTVRVKNIMLCNGSDRTSPDPQIEGCSALIASGQEAPQTVAVAHNNRANAYVMKGEYDLAIKDYNEAIKLVPNSASYLNNRGVAYKKKAEYDRALEDFDQSIRLNPAYAGAFANRAGTYVHKAEYERAAHDYDEAIRLGETVPEV